MSALDLFYMHGCMKIWAQEEEEKFGRAKKMPQVFLSSWCNSIRLIRCPVSPRTSQSVNVVGFLHVYQSWNMLRHVVGRLMIFMVIYVQISTFWSLWPPREINPESGWRGAKLKSMISTASHNFAVELGWEPNKPPCITVWAKWVLELKVSRSGVDLLRWHIYTHTRTHSL